MKKPLVLGSLALLTCVIGYRPAEGQSGSARAAAPPASTERAQTERKLLDQYCVTCHNDKLKTANLSLEKAGSDYGRRSPGGVGKGGAQASRRHDASARHAAAAFGRSTKGSATGWKRRSTAKPRPHPNPGSVVLHRLNRTEYANAIRDLLDLEIDVTTLLPPDDSARGFDNVAGSLTISPTLLEAYTTAATQGRPHGGRLLEIAHGSGLYRAGRHLAESSTSRVCLSARAAECWFATASRPMANTSSRSRTSASANSFPARSWSSSSTTSECDLTDYVGVGLSPGMSARQRRHPSTSPSR